MTNSVKFRRVLSSILLAGFGLLVPISGANAHTDLVSTSPSADSDVNAALETISLTFSEPPLVDGAAIVVVNEAGEMFDSPAPTLEGASLSIPWPIDLAPGSVTIQWRATAQDGHVESGEFVFNYTAAAESGPAPSPETTESATPAESPVPATTETATPEVIATPIAIEATSAESNNSMVIVIAIVALAGLIAAGLFLRRSK
jgi:methionine-rich copper-binding protein CopC